MTLHALKYVSDRQLALDNEWLCEFGLVVGVGALVLRVLCAIELEFDLFGFRRCSRCQGGFGKTVSLPNSMACKTWLMLPVHNWPVMAIYFCLILL